jgi:hypothetical protein
MRLDAVLYVLERLAHLPVGVRADRDLALAAHAGVKLALQLERLLLRRLRLRTNTREVDRIREPADPLEDHVEVVDSEGVLLVGHLTPGFGVEPLDLHHRLTLGDDPLALDLVRDVLNLGAALAHDGKRELEEVTRLLVVGIELDRLTETVFGVEVAEIIHEALRVRGRGRRSGAAALRLDGELVDPAILKKAGRGGEELRSEHRGAFRISRDLRGERGGSGREHEGAEGGPDHASARRTRAGLLGTQLHIVSFGPA